MAISKFKATCLAAIERVRKTGRPLLITKRGKPVAQVIPPPEPEPVHQGPGSMAGRARILGDIIAPAADEEDWEALR